MNATVASVKSGICGFKRLQVLRADRSIKIDTGWQKNLITDRGIDYMCNTPGEVLYGSQPGTMLNRCTVGTGNTTPAFSDIHLAGTILGTMINNAATETGVWANTPEYYIFKSNTYEFPLGAVVGNVAEVGIGPSTVVLTAPYSDLMSRSLVLDEFGAPTTITVLSDEILRVFYELRCYCDMAADATYTVDISGVTYDVVMRPSLLGTDGTRQGGPYFTFNTFGNFTNAARIFRDQTLGASTSEPPTAGGGAVSFNYDSVAGNTYVQGDHYRDMILVVNVNDGNFVGGIGALQIGTFWGKWQMSFTPKIPKDNLKILTIPFRHTYTRI